MSNQVAELATALESERSQSAEKIELLKNAEEQLSNRFKTLASEILEDKTKRFTEQNKTNLDQLLEPLKVKITEFQGKVQEVYVQEGKDRSAWSEQVKQLMALNNQLSKTPTILPVRSKAKPRRREIGANSFWSGCWRLPVCARDMNMTCRRAIPV